jgi:hypothetical protein
MTLKINIRPLKDFAVCRLPATSPLREVLLREEDEISVMSFLDRLPIWLLLIRWTQK